MSSLMIFAGPTDDASLRRYAASIGLKLLHPLAKEMSDVDNDRAFDGGLAYQGGLFSFLPLTELHTLDTSPHVLSEALDPLILYVRPHYDPPHLVAGGMFLNTDATKFVARTRPYFNKLRQWVRTNWKRREEDKYYIGPDAERVLANGIARIAYFSPSARVRTIYT